MDVTTPGKIGFSSSGELAIELYDSSTGAWGAGEHLPGVRW